ncbi:hypothetical protein JL2886_02330 [Phaeobacter gallaeciensis]|uniref:Uncharacterized protein n=1 Tax=Phaeobacter gallaeciensis TaxID=60890 RepID=A0A1B0ZSZ2_9RHOB|nr:hypothetical protein JL2886_02330 [Phaeobacter gallaeciensis]
MLPPGPMRCQSLPVKQLWLVLCVLRHGGLLKCCWRSFKPLFH